MLLDGFVAKGVNFVGGTAGVDESLGGDGLGLGKRNLTEGVLDARHLRDGHAEFVNPEPNEQNGVDRVGRHVSANCHGDVVLLPCLDRLRNQARDRGVEGLVQVGDVFIESVRR